MDRSKKKRILLVDDNSEIHNDYRKILALNRKVTIDENEAILFDMASTSDADKAQEYDIDSAYQGQEALELVKKSLLDKAPYALGFVDMRMPPGWDGIETIQRIWKVDPNIQMVICSAYSDHSWDDITRELGQSDNLLILKKPFELIEIKQLASALTRKWELLAHLHRLVKIRTSDLENLHALTHATLESIKEGILAVELDKSISINNHKFLTLWDLTIDELQSQQSDKLFEILAQRVQEPVLFQKKMNDIMLNPKITTHTEWQLKNDAILELYSHPQYLDEKITGVVYSFLDITERKTLESQLLHQATHDTLTGLPNRALLLDRIEQAIANADRFNLQVGFLMMDLDAFKEVNDSLGHKAGDLVLKSHAKRLSNFVRANDTVARVGGDEFVVILAAQTYDKKFIGFLHKLQELFLKPCMIDGHEVVVTVTIGVSVYPQDGKNPDTLLKNADNALYHAKGLGLNQFQFYREEMNKTILKRTQLRSALAHALEKKELTLKYQPLIDLQSEKTIGVEALLRWKHPTLGDIPPSVFISIAEETGLIVDIGEWVLRTACTQAKRWHQNAALSTLKMSVNISVKQFRDKHFVTLIRQILDETQFNPRYLELEITEGLILENVADVIEKMIELKKIGVRFAIDDFGTGYSSFSYLKHFPFDTIKIDKMFIDNITSDVSNASIVEAIIGLTKSMKINVLAEGVEKREQINFLREHHGNQVQGYYFSKPLSRKDCTQFLKKNSAKTG